MEMLEERQTRGFGRIEWSAELEKRILFLDPPDRKLLEMTFSGRLTHREAGMLIGRTAGTVTRQIRRLLRRLNDPLVTALVRDGRLLPELHQEVGLAFFLRKTPLERVAAECGISYYAARRMIAYIRGWHAASKGR